MKDNMLKNEQLLSKYACLDKDSIRLKELKDNDIRPNYFRDIDRIIYSLSYSRYVDKTQVFSNIENDHISRRIIHVQLVSKIARTIGRALNLNEDLIEAIALGHDIGHVPFGHAGEKILNKISMKHGEGPFMHNAQSVRVMMELDRGGEGNNLTVQVLDGILCHNGEFEQKKYEPISKTPQHFLNDYHNCFKDSEYLKQLIPMTLEGCVVRISDIIGYIGRDVEDAIRLGVIDKFDLPKKVLNTLGDSNGKIVNTIILDVINNSYNKPYIELSEDIFQAIVTLKKFNYEKIYSKANTEEDLKKFEEMFNLLFETYLADLKKGENKTSIRRMFLNEMNGTYLEKTTDERKVIDYIAGMTDDFFCLEYQSLSNDSYLRQSKEKRLSKERINDTINL